MSYDDEIDLFKLFGVLWQSKWVIGLMGFIATMLGGAFILITEPSYESRITFRADAIPPFYEAGTVLADFEKLFYTESVFDAWQKAQPDIAIKFDQFRNTELIDGFLLAKNEKDQFASVEKIKQESHIVIRSANLRTLDDFHRYALHINGLLNQSYVERARQELQIIDMRFNDLSAANEQIISTVLSIDRFVSSAEKGASIIIFNRPTMPEKTHPRTSLIMGLVVVLGLMAGAAYSLAIHAYRSRKQTSA